MTTNIRAPQLLHVLYTYKCHMWPYKILTIGLKFVSGLEQQLQQNLWPNVFERFCKKKPCADFNLPT